MLLLTISLILTAALAFIGSFIGDGHRKLRIICAIIAIILLIVSWIKAKDDAIENDKAKVAVQKSDSLLRETKSKLEHQTNVINKGFDSLQKSVAGLGINQPEVFAGLRDLKYRIDSFTNIANGNIALSLGLPFKPIKIIKDTVLPPPPPPPPALVDTIKIPFGDRTSRFLDSKNQFAIFEEQEDSQQYIRIMLNGFPTSVAAGGEKKFINDKGVAMLLVYGGKRDGQLLFYIKGK